MAAESSMHKARTKEDTKKRCGEVEFNALPSEEVGERQAGEQRTSIGGQGLQLHENFNNATVKKSQKVQEDLLTCFFCAKRFMTQKLLESHESRHTLCDVCGKHYASQSNLRHHMLEHELEEERPFSCHLCPRRFWTQWAQLEHMKNHPGERPFQCQLCPKRFSSKGNLKLHQRAHKGKTKLKKEKA